MFLSAGSSEEAVIALVNSVNTFPIPLEAGDLFFGTPKVLPGTPNKVTFPTIPMYDAEYEGRVSLTWTRYNLSAAFGGLRPIVRDIGQTTLHRLLPTINKVLGTHFQPADFYDVSFDWIGNNEQLNIELRALPNSLGYVGSFVVQYTRIRPQLVESILRTHLTALPHPTDIALGKHSLDMLSWGLDFTDYVASSLVTWSYAGELYWVYPDRVTAAMTDVGIANFPVSNAYKKLKLYATSQLPAANKAFTHVYVQTEVDSAGYTGTAYFHHNRS